MTKLTLEDINQVYLQLKKDYGQDIIEPDLRVANRVMRIVTEFVPDANITKGQIHLLMLASKIIELLIEEAKQIKENEEKEKRGQSKDSQNK